MATRSEPAAPPSETRTARSAPIASALRSELTARSGPIETITTSPSPVASFSRSASSTALASNAFSAPSPERSSRFVPGSIRLCAVASGTSLTQTAIFIAPDSNDEPQPRRSVAVYPFGGGIGPNALLGSRASSAIRTPMTRRRLTPRGAILILFAFLLTAAGASTAAAGNVPTLVFPILGQAQYTDDFGDPRGQGAHEGNDILAPRRALALAAEAGTVKFHTTSSRAGCMLYLEGESGTEYLYIHLNNDLGMGNDNRGTCVPGIAYARGLRSGDAVAPGQPIAFVGDSGDADGIHPHLHFEVHPNGGGAVSPYPYLRKARRLVFAAQRGTMFTLALTGKVVASAGSELSLSLDQVRSWPGGRMTRQAGQKVAVSVPESAAVEGLASATGLDAFPALDRLTKGLLVTVWTAPAKVTFAAQSGAKGALAASRVVVRP